MISYVGQVRGHYNVGKSTLCANVKELERDGENRQQGMCNPTIPLVESLGSKITEIHDVKIRLDDKRLQMFSDAPASTELLKTHFNHMNTPSVNVKLMDTSAFDRCDSMLPAFYRRNLAFIMLVFSCDSPQSLTFILNVMDEMERRQCHTKTPKYVVCNKIDLFANSVNSNYNKQFEMLKKKAEEHLDAGIFTNGTNHGGSHINVRALSASERLKKKIMADASICQSIHYVSFSEHLGVNQLMFTIMNDALQTTLNNEYELHHPPHQQPHHSSKRQHVGRLTRVASGHCMLDELRDGRNYRKNKYGIIKMDSNGHTRTWTGMDPKDGPWMSPPKAPGETKLVVLNESKSRNLDEDDDSCCY